ncbi:hypothetical protein GCM10023210_36780 [Chryseobacterium ginsengisoli]|uniref:HTH cro/C1-type domain-containing protein n=1 Tax=Chryseobacterium ginsengisoli TaxID=363853 RepID=A0ABP9MPK6_9FLAO
MSNSDYEIEEQLKIFVKKRFGKPLNSIKSFEELSENTNLSVQTLRRFFGKIDKNKKIGLTSLSLLCKYVGFADWQDFSLNFENQQNISDKDKIYIENMLVFFENGERYNIDYHQNTMTVDTLNDYAKVIYYKKENLQFFYSLYQKNNWCSDYFLAWLPNYNFFGQDWFRNILMNRISQTKNILVKLALNNFLLLGFFLSNGDCELAKEMVLLDKIYKDYRENHQYMPYHEMRYHTVKLIFAKRNDDEESFQKIFKVYIDGLENSKLEEIHQQEMLIFFCNTLLWLEEYDIAYYYLKKAKPFLKSFPIMKDKQKTMHFFGINMAFVKTTFALAWVANQDSKIDDLELTDSDFNDITGLLYNDYIKIMYLVKCIIYEKGLAKKKLMFQELKQLVEKTNYSKIYNLLEDLDSDFSKYFA